MEASVRSSSPVLSRLIPENQSGYRPPAGYGQAPPAYAGQQTVITPAQTDRMTIDDVVVRTVGLLLVTGISGALAWTIVGDAVAMPVMFGAALVGVALGLFISFKQITNPGLILAYAVVEGVFLGVISRYFEALWSGIVVQAAVGTFGVFFIMALLYKSRVIRATPKFVKYVTAAAGGLFALMLVNFVLSLFNVSTGLRGDGSGHGGWLAIGFSIVCIVVAAMTLVIDFAQVEEGVRRGMPKQFAWACSFGILVGLIWLYLEILRLLSYLRGSD